MPKYNEYPVVTAAEVDADDLLLWEIDGVTKKMTKAEFVTLLVNAGSGQYNQSVSFNASVPFNYAKTIMAGYNMSLGAITLTPNTTGAINGAETIVPIIADGTNVPVFSAFTETVGSNGYDNTSGVTSYFQFVKVGSTYLLTITQEVASIPVDTTAPTIVSAQIANAERNKIEITFNEDVRATVPAGSSIVATGATTGAQTASSMTRSAVDKIKVTFPTNWVSGEDVSFAYTAPGTNPIKDTAGNNLANVTAQSVTNNIVGAIMQFIPGAWAAASGGYVTTTGSPGNDTAFTTTPLAAGQSFKWKGNLPQAAAITVGFRQVPFSGANESHLSYKITFTNALFTDSVRYYLNFNGVFADAFHKDYWFELRNNAGTIELWTSVDGSTGWVRLGNPLDGAPDLVTGLDDTWYIGISMDSGTIESISRA